MRCPTRNSFLALFRPTRFANAAFRRRPFGRLFGTPIGVWAVAILAMFGTPAFATTSANAGAAPAAVPNDPAAAVSAWWHYTWEQNFNFFLLGPIICFAAILIAYAIRAWIEDWLYRIAQRTPTTVDDFLVRAFSRTAFWGTLGAGAFAWVFFWTHYWHRGTAAELATAVQASLCVLVVFALVQLVDALGEWVKQLAARTKSQLDDALAVIATRIGKIVVVVVGVVILVEILGASLDGLLVGLAVVAGLALVVGFDAVRGFSSSLQLLAEHPFDVGDVILVEGIVGHVRQIGLRATRLETPERTELWVPNRLLLERPVENLSRRTSRRHSFTLALPADTNAETVQKIIEAIRAELNDEPAVGKRTARTDADGTPLRDAGGEPIFEGVDPLVALESISAGAYHILVQYDLTELAFAAAAMIHERLLLTMLRTLETHEVQFTAPTTTPDEPDDDAAGTSPKPPKPAARKPRAKSGTAKSSRAKTKKKSPLPAATATESADSAASDESAPKISGTADAE